MRLTLCLAAIILLAACSRQAEEDEAPRAYPGEVPASIMSDEEARSAERALEESLHLEAPSSAVAGSDASD